MLKTKLSNLRLFDEKKSFIDDRIDNEFMDNGIVTIPCKVDGMEDIISKYSIKNYESLSDEFVSYVTSTVEAMPIEYPVVLSIVGYEFTDEEQKMIKETIEADFAYNLGLKEKENKYNVIIFFIMFLGMIATGVLIYFFGSNGGFSVEMLFVFFWFFAEMVVGYLLIEGFTLKRAKIVAGRLACIEVAFSKEYDEREYTKSEVKQIIGNIKKNKKHKPYK